MKIQEESEIIKSIENLKFEKVFVKYKDDEEIINITDLNVDQYETFLSAMALLNGRYLEIIRNKRIETLAFGNPKL